MKHARLQQLLSSYGADPARWPEPERIGAQQLSAQLAGDPELAAAFADACAIDATLVAIDHTHGAVDDLRTQRLLQSLQVRIQSLPQTPRVDAEAQLEAPCAHIAYATVPARAIGARKRRSYVLAWAAMLPLMFGFLAGVTSEAGDTQGLLERALVQTAPDASSSVDANYADETMMAPFVAAAEFSTASGVHN